MKADKAAPIRDIWLMLNSNLKDGFNPYECLTVDEQLFPYRGRTKFTQYIPSKPAKYEIKIFWICDSKTAFPLRGEIYTGKASSTDPRQSNVGKNVVINLFVKAIQEIRQECHHGQFLYISKFVGQAENHGIDIGRNSSKEQDIPPLRHTS